MQHTDRHFEAVALWRTDKTLPDFVVACSPLMMAVYRDAPKLMSSSVGLRLSMHHRRRPGVGKEVLADVVHRWSSLPARAIVKVNCAAIPENLLESRIGQAQKEGSFTGAHAQRIGRFEEANDGTIFLDEVAEMSPQLQAKLLRVTQNGTFQRVGSNREVRTNARILAASNRNLEDEVKNGRFREGFCFYQVERGGVEYSAVTRRRREDILPLASSFITEFAKGHVRAFPEAVVACLEAYPWPGNVREVAQCDGTRGVARTGAKVDFADAFADQGP